MESYKQLLDEIICPADEFTPIPFWFLNDTFDFKKLKGQLLDFKEKGVMGVVLHPRIGILKTTEYLSDDYFTVIEFIVDTAAELHMTVVLYDEAMYPSGSAHGEIVKANSMFASTGITIVDSYNAGNCKILAEYSDGKCLVQKYTGGTIRGIHFGEDDGEIDAPKSADILNPDVVELFIQLTHEQYYKRLGKYFGNTIIGFFTDEPCILGRNVKGFFEWTDGLEDELIAMGGIVSDLHGLFENVKNQTTELYKHLIVNRINQTYYQKLSNWCDRHNIALMGHPSASDDIDEEMYFQIPGQDLVFRWVSPEKGGLIGKDSVQAKCSSDAARHQNRRRNSNECFGVCSRGIPWYFTAEDMKWYIDWLGVRGVNLFIPHAFYYSLDDARKDERPPDVGPNNIWWPYYKQFSDYIKRISFLMTDSVNSAKIAVLCESRHMPYDEVIQFYENQIEFNYLPKSMLRDCTFSDGKLQIAGCEYDAFFSLDDINLPVRRIKDFKGAARDFIAESDSKYLRLTHLVKYGIDMYFIVNEGDEGIETFATIPDKGIPVFMDLWNTKCYLTDYEVIGDRIRFNISLKRRESLLILLNPTVGFIPDVKPTEIMINEIPESIKMISHDAENFIKIYYYEYETEKVIGCEMFEVKAEEMVECYCNGAFVGVSFWNVHRFNIGSFLKHGNNRIELVITGNIANKYTANHIAYGIIGFE